MCVQQIMEFAKFLVLQKMHMVKGRLRAMRMLYIESQLYLAIATCKPRDSMCSNCSISLENMKGNL